MSRLLMSAAIAALMSAPAMAQADPAMTHADNAQASSQAAGGAADWKTSHGWINAAAYDEAGDQVGTVNRVRLSDSGDGVRALVLDTGGFLDKGMRHISLLSDEATVITRDALPASWMVTREGRTATPGEPASDGEPMAERRWWEFGRGDEDASGDSAAMPNFTLITLDFTADEIAMMPQFTAGSSSEAQSGPVTASNASASNQAQADAAVGLASASDDESDAPRTVRETAASTATDDSDDAAMQSVEDREADDDVAADESQDNGREPTVASTDTRVALVTNDEREAAGAERASETDDAASPDKPATNESADPFSLAWTDIESAMDSRTGAERSEDGESDTPEWTDQHDWVNTAVYSRGGEQIGEIERVRGGADAQHPSAIVLETGGFLDIGGREVQLSGANFRLTDYEGEQVLQIRYTGDEIMQMPTFNEADTSDYMLSDNPLEADETETETGDDETGSGGTR